MRVSLDWIRELVPFAEEGADLARRLTMAGVEVEGVSHPGAGNRGLLAARVVSTAQIPGKSLLLCTVDGGAAHQVVCGDITVSAGDVVAYAPAGSTCGGKAMGSRKFAGVESAGMLCSLADMGLEEKSPGVLRLPGAKPGDPLEKSISFSDEVWELNVTPNRADCLSHWGVARELAAILGKSVAPHRPKVHEKGTHADASVKIEDPAGCPFYSARQIHGVKVGPSPLWVQLRLEKAGMRAINNVVDATNLVLLELGQPLHAFDLARLDGHGVSVRRARAGERIALLDGKEHELAADDLVIASKTAPVALAGVMGGAGSEVDGGTRDILLESAFFDPVSVRKSSKRHGLHTEASHRFERTVDAGMVVPALERCAALIAEWAGGSVLPGLLTAGDPPVARAEILLRKERIARILGFEVPAAEVKEILKHLGCAVESKGHDLSVTPPTWRSDLTAEVDLIEEIVRLHGFDKVPVTQPTTPVEASPVLGDPKAALTRQWMAAAGFHEVVTYSFTSPQWVPILGLTGRRASPIPLGNPLTVEQSVMRTTLAPSLLEAAGLNWRRGNTSLKLFDVGRIFLPGDQHEERHHACACVFGPWDETLWGDRSRAADFYDLKGVLEGLFSRLGVHAHFRKGSEPFLHPGLSATLEVAGAPAGWIGRLHPEVARKLDLPEGVAFELNLDALKRVKPAGIVAPGKFPPVMRDVAFLVRREVTSDAVAEALRGPAPSELESLVLFDAYAGDELEGRKNLAFHLRFQAPDRTLTEQEIEAFVAAMVKSVVDRAGGELRAQ